MTKDRAIRLARKWASGRVCTLRDGEAEEYHKLCCEALEQTRWVPVEERLPELNTRVLVYRDGCFAVSEIWIYDYEQKPMWDYTGIGGDPTHWMPLPNGPEE